MDDEQKKIAIGAVIAVFVFMLLFFFMSGKPSKQIRKEYTTTVNKAKHKKPKKDKKSEKHYSSHNTRRSSSSKAKTPYTSEKLQAMEERRKAAIKNVRKVQQKWLMNKVDDVTLTEETRTKYRFRAIKSYGKGIEAIKNKDYKEALKHFRESLKDPLATPVTKCLAYMYMRNAAKKLKDLDLYIMIMKVEAKLMATEDLSVIGIKKSNSQVEWVDNFERVIQAANSRKGFQDLVNKRVQELEFPPNERHRVEAMVNREIDEYRSHFKEFIKYDKS